MSERQILTARLRQSVPLNDFTKHLEFEVEGSPQFGFTPGQFVSMQAEHEGREITRAYSLASAPRTGGAFDVCLNRVQDGFFSNHLCDLPEGSQVKFHGPHGYFVLKQPVRNAIFIGTGTGVAPLRGMLQWLFEDPLRHEGREFWLVFGARYHDHLYYKDEFEGWAKEHSNFHYLPTLSRPDDSWTGKSGYVQQHVPGLVGGRKDIDAYICGLKDMVKANRDLLVRDLGWDRRSVLYERFD
jgi:ferredoxin-NADP reductase